MSEWVAWHEQYVPGSQLARRLIVVQDLIRAALDSCPPGPIHVVSMCAGDGRDLLGVLPEHPRRPDVRARLVELDPQLAERCRGLAAQVSAGVEVVQGDASNTSAYAGAVPADLVLVCGVFGNITDADVRATIDHLPALCAAGATVIWTRGTFEPDLTPSVRAWFAAAGFDEIAFVTIPGTTASVGAHRLVSSPRAYEPGVRLFSFLSRAERPSQRPPTR